MLKKIGIGAAFVVGIFLGFVASRPSHFYWETSAEINASPEKIFPYISSFKKGSEWSPFEKIDPNMKKTYSDNDGQVGSTMEFDGNAKAGSGRLEMLKIEPNQLVNIRLLMTKPMAADNLIEYKLTPHENKTTFTWSMSGDMNYFGKLISVFIDCKKMTLDQFEKGIANLKALVESQP